MFKRSLRARLLDTTIAPWLCSVEGETGTGDGGTGTGTGTGTGSTGTTDAWHTGLDSELIGHATNRGWDKLDGKAAAQAALKAHRDAERHLGVPAEQVLRLRRTPPTRPAGRPCGSGSASPTPWTATSSRA
jgi:hypothetical protein